MFRGQHIAASSHVPAHLVSLPLFCDFPEPSGEDFTDVLSVPEPSWSHLNSNETEISGEGPEVSSLAEEPLTIDSR